MGRHLMELRALTPELVYEAWDWIRNGLLVCIDKTGARYLPEDVYLRLKAGTAWAYLIGAEEFGFVILTQEYDPDGLVLFIWALWTEPGQAREVDAEIYAALDDLARQARAKRIRMNSPRKGWEREGFFDQVSAVYEHDMR